MTFLASASEKMFLLMQQNQKAYELNCVNLRFNSAQRNMNYIEEQYRDVEDYDVAEDNDYYIYLETLSEQLEEQKEALDDEIELLKNQVSSLASIVKDGIKNSCGLTLSGS